jgi:hypothetical protein
MNTHTTTTIRASKLFMPHPNLGDRVNGNIVQSEIEGGVYLDDLSEGAVLEVETQNHEYTVIVRGRDTELIWGHPKYCPDPVAVRIAGSTWGGSMLKARFVGRGMHLEFCHPSYRTITTSPIVDIRAKGQCVTNLEWAKRGRRAPRGDEPECDRKHEL